MSTTIHVGKKRVCTVAGSDASVIPAGTLSVVSSAPASVSAAVDASNNVTLTGLAPTGAGNAMVTYAAPGYGSFVQSVAVPVPPSIVVTDGPEL